MSPPQWPTLTFFHSIKEFFLFKLDPYCWRKISCWPSRARCACWTWKPFFSPWTLKVKRSDRNWHFFFFFFHLYFISIFRRPSLSIDDCHCHENDHSLPSRFSSGDLTSELDDEPNAEPGVATMVRQDSSHPYQGIPDRPLQSQPGPVPPANQPPVPGAPPGTVPVPVAPSSHQPIGGGGDLSLNLRPSSRTTSAPSSPAKTRETLLQRVQSFTGAARDQVSLTYCIINYCVCVDFFPISIAHVWSNYW